MSGRELRRDGELFLRLEAVAEIYRVEAVWLHEVVDLGLVGRSLVVDSAVWIAAVELDRVAAIVRLSALCGPDPSAIALAVRLDPAP